MAEDSGELVSGTVSWFSVIKGYGVRGRGGSRAAGRVGMSRRRLTTRRAGFITRTDGGGDVFVHQVRRARAARGCARGASEQSLWGCLPAAGFDARRGCIAPQSDLHSEGFRSLREGEEVQFSMGLTAEGGRPKALLLCLAALRPAASRRPGRAPATAPLTCCACGVAASQASPRRLT